MKKMMNLLLTMVCGVCLLTACRTTSTVERRTTHVETQKMSRTDSATLHTADSVLVLVEKNDSMVRIIEKKVHTRERVKVVRDTVVIHARNDTIVKVESVREQVSRSPPYWSLFLVLGLLTVVTLVAVKYLTIKKHFLQHD